MKIQMVHKDSQNLSNMINFTSNLADNVSNKVRQLDLAKVNKLFKLLFLEPFLLFTKYILLLY